MGLRIVDRRGTEPGITEADMLKTFKLQTERSADVKGDKGVASFQEFVENFRRVRARIRRQRPENVNTMAELVSRIRDDIKSKKSTAVHPHGHIDVATLLELL